MRIFRKLRPEDGTGFGKMASLIHISFSFPAGSRGFPSNFSPALWCHCGCTGLAALQSSAPAERNGSRVFGRLTLGLWLRLVIDCASGNVDDELRELVRITRAGFS
jgi:hypothetical protein